MAGLEEWGGWGRDGGGEDTQGILLDELEESFDGGFSMDCAEIHNIVAVLEDQEERNEERRERQEK